jgi:hypothetical protein
MATDCSSVLASQVFASDRRRQERGDSELHTVATDQHGVLFQARLLNLSRTGFMMRTEHPLTEHERVAIDVPTVGPLNAWIVWSMADKVGGSFVSAIDAETYDMVARLFALD